MTKPCLSGITQTSLDRSQPILRPGNTNCGGCGMSIGLNFLTHAVANRPIQMVIPACCGIVTAGAYPFSAYGAPVLASTFASAAAVATGLSQVARLNAENTRVICWTGDGGTFDIGMATLSAAAERNEDILYICYDNEIYGNTGGQRSSATPLGAVTTTTPEGKGVIKKDILAVMAAHHIPYAASISLAHPEDTLRKMKYAVELQGFRFLHILSPCPTGWKSEPEKGIELIELAITSGLYPVYEIFNGHEIKINVEPEQSSKLAIEALSKYVSLQGRFKSTVELEHLYRAIKLTWTNLRTSVN
ncbi:pyruvate synthase subunit beta [Candidatus Nomurabacteria bacterium]|nr:pyruvate synthase subunit beta [Candidatus Nomurabacteria bacterium]